MNEADWDKLKAAFQENTYYPADVTWNGQTVRNVGIRSRGLGSRSATKPGLARRLRSLLERASSSSASSRSCSTT